MYLEILQNRSNLSEDIGKGKMVLCNFRRCDMMPECPS